MKKIISLILLLFVLKISLADASSGYFDRAIALYSEGKYQSVVDELSRIEKQSNFDKKTSGFISYWKAMSFNRIQEFPLAVQEFKKALSQKYSPSDIHYEYGQALFASEKFVEAKIQFSESFKKSFKRGASLYYMAFISKELGERDNALALWNSTLKLPDAEMTEVKQASQMQLSDMELEDAEKKSDVFRVIESEVIPSYEKAKDINEDSSLAKKIQEKIVNLQKKYDLVLFQLRNGRPTLIPPYFLRLAQEGGFDSNVTFSPTETVISKAKQSSLFSKTEVLIPRL
jgi:tetratricopeptide (TPR) repeat protein